jgi:hypothetical protein
MRSLSFLLTLFLVLVASSSAQVVSPAEIKDPVLREMERESMNDLMAVGRQIFAIKTDYPFYLSRKLDLDEAQQKSADQRGIRFDHFNGKTVLAITGNYYASYLSDLSPERRARETFLNVGFLILRAAVPPFQNNPDVQGYALEISHHVRGKVMDVAMERPENLFVYLPRSAALKLLAAKDGTGQQAALLEGQFLLNGEPVTIWLNGEGPPPTPVQSQASSEKLAAEVGSGSNDGTQADAASLPVEKSKTVTAPPAMPSRDTSTAALGALEAVNSQVLSNMAKELGGQAHLIPYAPPAFVAFRQGIYLQLSMTADLPESAAGSRYKLAAMAFDEHIAHLVRPVLVYFKGEQQFDGIDFSTSVHLPAKSESAAKSESVEFFFPFSALRCYEKYDCTGQQLIDAGTVLINGERVGLDLEIAEGGMAR